MSTMSVSERRFRDGEGQRYLTTQPNRVRCQGASKTKLRELRIERGDPTLTSEDVWPECQCPKAAVEGTYLCSLHGGKSITIVKQTVAESMPVDLYDSFKTLQANREQLVNRTNEIGQLLARNAQLYASLEDLVIGEEGYQAVADAKKYLQAGDIQKAIFYLNLALEGTRTEKEVWTEVRTNTQIINTLTTTQFNIEKELKLMTSIDQMKSLLNGLYRGIENIFARILPDEQLRAEGMKQVAILIRDLANVRQGSLSG